MNSSTLSSFSPKSIALIDSSIGNTEELLQGITVDHVVTFNSQQDGVAQISQQLASYDNLASVHIFAHGSDASLQLGRSTLNSTTLQTYADDLAQWGQAMSESGDVFLYGCNVASTPDGLAFIQQLSQATGADVAASDDLTGYGGDWVLEAQVGTIEAPLGVDTTALQQYTGTLIQFTDVADQAGIAYSGESHSGAWGDVNGDGLPDLWRTNHNSLPTLFLNQGDGTFIEDSGFEATPNKDTHGSTFTDFDNDGDQDLLVVTGADFGLGTDTNLLYVNDNGVLTDRAADFGIDYGFGRGRTPLWLDYDQDGKLDLVLSNLSRGDGLGDSTVFRQTDTGFEDVKEAVGFNVVGSRYALASDVNRDGQLDILVQGTATGPFRQGLTIYDPSTSTFSNLSSLLPDDVDAADGDMAIADFNGDLRPDIFVARNGQTSGIEQTDNSTVELFLQNINTETGLQFSATEDVFFDFKSTFELQLTDIFIGATGNNPTSRQFTLSADDPANQGLFPHTPSTDPGVYVGYDPGTQRWNVSLSATTFRRLVGKVTTTGTIANWESVGFDSNEPPLTDRLLINTPNGFVDQSESSGITLNPNASESVVAGDFDNDKDVDIYIVGQNVVGNRPNTLYENQGDGTFIEVPDVGGAAGSTLGVGESVFTADYDQDGFLDLLVTNGRGPIPVAGDGPTQLFRNDGNDNNWLEIDLEGIVSNKDGIGAQVYVTSGGTTQLREQNGGVHKHAQNHQRLHFGLAGDTVIDELRIVWPSGLEQVLTNVDVNQILSITESGDTVPNSQGWAMELPFDETSGTIAADISPQGQNNAGTLQNGATFEPVGADLNGGVRFDGVDDYVSVADSFDINQGKHAQRSVSVWFKADRIDGGKQVIFEEGGNTRGLNIYLDNGRLYVGGWNIPESSWTGTYLSTTDISDNTWHHVSLVLDAVPDATTVQANAFTAYLDGTEFGQGDGSQLWGHSDDTGLGAIAQGTRFHDGVAGAEIAAFSGVIANASLYNRALEPIEVAAQAAISTPISLPTPPSALLDGADIVVGEGTTYDFTVTFSDDEAIDITTLDNNDIQVTGPNGFSQLATLISIDSAENGTPRTATYQISAPGDGWDDADNGTYTITLNEGEVGDIDGNTANGETLGTFSVTVDDVSSGELLQNPGFEAGITSWDDFTGTEQVTSDAFSGGQALQLSSSGSGVLQLIDVTPGETYQLSAYAKTTSNRWNGLGIRFRASDGAALQTNQSRIATADWARYDIESTVPSNAVLAEVFIWNGGDSGLTSLDTVSLQLVNGEDSNQAPDIVSNGGQASVAVTVDENSTAILNIEAVDPDGDTEGSGLTYTLTGIDSSQISINPDTGELTFNSAPDFESPTDANGNNDYELQVTVTDSSGLSDVQDIVVNVTDVAENTAPVITSEPTASVGENQTSAIDVNATDNADSEGAGLTYSITGGADQSLFSIDANTGVVTFNSAPDFEAPGDANGNNDYEVDVVVTDSEGTTDIQQITITVQDIVDAGVIFFDDFETSQGWVVNPNNSDTATTGQWEVTNPEQTALNGVVQQLGTTVSGSQSLVTDGTAGSSVGSFDVDNGLTSVRSPQIVLPETENLIRLSFNYYLAHLNNANANDFLRVTVVGVQTSRVVLLRQGDSTDQVAAWTDFSADISDFAGETIALLVETQDGGTPSLVEAAIDDLTVEITS